MDAAEIQDYGIIGNGRSCALISRWGSLDWLCWPRFDSPFIFGALLDSKKGGSWKIQPTNFLQVTRRYIEDTNVLETHFYTETGEMVITDFMSVFSEAEKNRQLNPEHEIIRQIKCVKGDVEVAIHFDSMPKYGKKPAIIKDLKKLGLRVEIDQQLIALHSNIHFEVKENEGAKATVSLKAEEVLTLALTYTLEGPAVIPPIDAEYVSYKLTQTILWWQNWAKKAKYHGPYRDLVIRSVLVLKLLGFAPSGAFIAAPTTSLPEKIGDILNWDYRYCWLRDAFFTVRALLDLGYREEAEAFISWLLHSTRLTAPELKAVYDVYGKKMIHEQELSYLEGYENSSPVRIGIATRDQLQLDVYGEVIHGVASFVQSGGKLDRESQKLVKQIGAYIIAHWNQKDSGIWEAREDYEFYTYSQLMCWVALDRLLQIKNECHLSPEQVQACEENRLNIKNNLEQHAWNEKIRAYTSYYGSESMDACVLLMPIFKFDSVQSARMKTTYEMVNKRLSVSPGLIYRYEKSIGNEGAFLLCSFWKVDYLTIGGGTLEEAHQEFKEILKYANDLGLFSEEVDIDTKKPLGNFPQAFTHLGLINSALLLQEKDGS